MTTIQALLDERSDLIKQRKRLLDRYRRTSASTIDGLIARNNYAREANALADEIDILTDKYNDLIKEI